MTISSSQLPVPFTESQMGSATSLRSRLAPGFWLGGRFAIPAPTLLLITLLLAPLSAQQENQRVDPKDMHKLRPPCGTQELLEKSAKARERGFQFLIESQNHDGSWGSHDPKIANLADFGFQLRNRGSQDAVRTACTAICAEALLYKQDRDQAEEMALQNAIKELLKVRKFAYHPGESFCTWGYGYKLAFLNAFLSSEEGAGIEEEIRKAAQSCADGLVRFQQHEGGWGVLFRRRPGLRFDVFQHGVFCSEPPSRCQDGA